MHSAPNIAKAATWRARLRADCFSARHALLRRHENGFQFDASSFFFFKGSNRAARRKSADFMKAENFLIVAREIFEANLLPVLSMNMHFLLPLRGGSLKTSESVRFQGTPVLMW